MQHFFRGLIRDPTDDGDFSRKKQLVYKKNRKSVGQIFTFVGTLIGMAMIFGAMLLLVAVFSDQPLF